jgi:hypothetical protein
MTGRLLTLCVAFVTTTAVAEEHSADTNSTDVTAKGAWYGWQIMLADLGVIAMLAGGGVATGSSSSFAFIPIIGGVTFYADGPLIHLGHGNSAGVRRSLLLRGLVPLGVAALGAGVGAVLAAGQRSHSEECNVGCAAGITATIGFGAGMLGAMIADWATAREPVFPAQVAQQATEPLWTPMVMLTPRGGGAGVVVRF